MENKILVIDIETTGFLNQGGAIVEVGMVSLDIDSGEAFVIFDSVCREDILNERHRVEPMGWIFRNSSLTVEDVRAAPLLDHLRDDIQCHIENHYAGATAYNRSFDFDFLKSRGFQFRKKLPCPMLLSTPICQRTPVRYGSFKWPKVEEAWACFFPDEEYVEQHRGADDALHEARIVFELYQRGVFNF
jgi:DNA polymerase III epsilon subunit-like protein